MNNRERVELLEEAQQHLRDAIEDIRKAVAGTNRVYSTEHDMIAQLENYEGSESFSMDATCKDLIDYFKEYCTEEC